MTPEDIKTALTAVGQSPVASEWAKGFSTSIIEQLNKGRKLSEKQMVYVNKILYDYFLLSVDCQQHCQRRGSVTSWLLEDVRKQVR